MRYAEVIVCRPKAFISCVLAFFVLPFALAGCGGGRQPPDDVDGGKVNDAGCPLLGTEPLFVIDIRADDGPVPADTEVAALWSAGAEPPFVLSDPATWKTLDDGVNLVCQVDRNAPPPVDLSALVCELWANGAVELSVTAVGYLPQKQTLEPLFDERCDAPLPMKHAILLSRMALDGGTSP